MRELWRYLASALFGFAVLSVAAVWMGGLNQDEGWYLYAAQLVGEGKLPYRDFFFTQGPILPIVYSAFAWTWRSFGLVGARAFTLLLGTAGLALAAALAYRMSKSKAAAIAVFILLGSNLYHLYYLALPKTYALAGLFVLVGFLLLAEATDRRGRAFLAAVAGAAFAFAAGTRISLGAILAVVGAGLLLRRNWRTLGWFCLGGFAGLALTYGPFLCDEKSLAGLLAAQKYHAARGGFDPTWTVGSLSRLVRWYLPVTVLFGMNALSRGASRPAEHPLNRLVLAAFLAVFAVQILAPFPYEDYQVPVMALLTVSSAVTFFSEGGNDKRRLLAILGMTWACSFGSPLLEKWSTNGQDRFWSLKKPKCELAQLRDVARKIETLDPGGKDLFTQDLYLAIETGRKVPQGLEMGPFAQLTDDEWRRLLESAPCRMAALSGYSFAIVPPACTERPVRQQIDFWNILKERYDLAMKEEYFGQNATTLMVLRRKERKE